MQLTRPSYHQDRGWDKPFPTHDGEQTLVMTFGDAHFRDATAPLDELQQAFPLAHHIGCSTSGEIHGDEVCDNSLSVAVLQFESTQLRSATASVTAADESFAAGRDLAEQLAQADGLRAIFLVSDGLAVNGSQLVNGINSIAHVYLQ